MTDNHLFQLAQVISDLSPSPTLPPLDHGHDQPRLPLRKNACAVCAICFTCSKNYSVDCTCEESQPRRGKNLPQGGLDSRAKKLNKMDKEDYEFTIQWLEENAHTIYREPTSNQVVGLANQTEVGLCKAHSSTLYRARKRREQQQHQHRTLSPSPMEYIDTPMDSSTSSTNGKMQCGGLAAKVKELSQHYQKPVPPDLETRPSTSYKRKRLGKDADVLSSGSARLPYSSTSTPLYGSSGYSSSRSYLSPQLPPLQPPSPVASSLNSLSSSLQQHLQLSTPTKYHHSPPLSSYNLRHHPFQQHHYHHHHHNNTTTLSITSVSPLTSQFPVQSLSSSASSSIASSQALSLSSSSSQASPKQSALPPIQPMIQIDTVSLRSMTSDDDESCIYFIRNLAITDTFTFRHLLEETDINGIPPPGKRIVIADPTSERIFPLSQPIRSVLPYPPSSHMEFCLGLTNKTPIHWNT